MKQYTCHFKPDQQSFLKEVAGMEKPDADNFVDRNNTMLSNSYFTVLNTYNEHIASLQTIPCPSMELTDDGRIVGEGEFEVHKEFWSGSSWWPTYHLIDGKVKEGTKTREYAILSTKVKIESMNKELIKKYETYIGNVEWHIRTNKPDGEGLRKCEERLICYHEIVKDLKASLHPVQAGVEGKLKTLLYRKLTALHLEVDASIVDDIKKTVDEIFASTPAVSSVEEDAMWEEVFEQYDERKYMAIENIKQSFTITRK